MKKTFSQKELKEKADKVFEQYPNATQAFATVDGNVFLMKNRAELHSKDKIYTFDRPVKDDSKAKNTDGNSGKKTGTDDKLTKAEDIIAFIEKAEKLDDIKPYAEDKRKTVIAAYVAKSETLAKDITVNT